MLSPVQLPKPSSGGGGQRLSVIVADELKQMILAGILSPGDRLPNESDLCDHFNVSRITIREGVQMLRALGFVETTRGRGTFVCEPDASAVLRDFAYFAFDSAPAIGDLFEVRTLLETTAARRAAQAVDRDRRFSLLELANAGIELFSRNGRPPKEELARLDATFHLAIAALSENLVLENLMERLMQLLEPVRARSLSVNGQPERSWNQHLKIAEAIAAGNADLAVLLVEEHMRGVTTALGIREID